tara:strand:- start:634 stop:1113 length:480 start_codon:yes stop_codon:yes gene_type:complete
MKFFYIFIILFSQLGHTEEFSLFCEGKRDFRTFNGNAMNIVDFESVLLKIKKDSMEYIGINSGRSYVFSNKEYTAPKRPPHEDIKIKTLYEFTPKTIKASQIITDIGNSEESSISQFSLNINLLTGKLTEIESISNKKTLQKSINNNFQATCKKEDRSY